MPYRRLAVIAALAAALSSPLAARAGQVYGDKAKLGLVCTNDVVVFGKDQSIACFRNLNDDQPDDVDANVSVGDMFSDFWDELTASFDHFHFTSEAIALGDPGCDSRTTSMKAVAGSRYKVTKIVGRGAEDDLSCVGDSKANSVTVVLENESTGQEIDLSFSAAKEPSKKVARDETIGTLRSMFDYAFWFESRQ